MPLPPPAPRTHAHLRRVEYRGYHRDDGLWDIEGHLRDTKNYEQTMPGRGVLPKGEPVHDMHVRVTIDDAMKIVDIHAAMPGTPFEECPRAEAPVRRLIGATLGRGWRRALDEAIGGTRGCTHLRELLFGAATAAFQTMGSYREHLRQQRGEPETVRLTPPFYMGQCMSWDFDGPVIARVAPQFIGWHHRQKG
ncbi:DUF2889 domain-containing protein [Pseudorhodoferax sp.]|uniref:DUF2889 domain-containing protein n=1 Tax=Pseudorhodoferax sp. TaxID=1993553 RepID=UPI0039E3AB14